LLKQASGIEKGSGTPGSTAAIGKVSLKHIYEIAKVKCRDEDLGNLGLERVAKSVVGSAKSLGLEVVP
jgi:large subunit ribosomal protein L11